MSYLMTRRYSPLCCEKEAPTGLYSIEHLIYIVIFFALIAFLLFLSRNVSVATFNVIHTVLAICITVTEVIKILHHVLVNSPIDSWVPLYFCGLFNFAVWFAKSKNRVLSSIGFSYMTMGGIFAGIFFTFYPSTSIGMYPIFHPEVFHAAFFHGAMIYLGVLALMRSVYKPMNFHLRYYFIFVTSACLVAVVINFIFGSNCMFLRDPYGLPILSPIEQWFPPAYMLLAWFGQSYALYKFSFWVYECLLRYKNKKAKDEQYE